MRTLVSFATVALLTEVVKSGTVLWSGNFDYYSSVSDFDTCECVVCQKMHYTKKHIYNRVMVE